MLQLATAPPLCLDPDPHLTSIANHVLRVSMPNILTSLTRNTAAMDPAGDEFEKARRAKIMQFINPRPNRSGAPRYVIVTIMLWVVCLTVRLCVSYRILDTIRRLKQQNPPPAPAAPPQDVALAMNPSQPQPVAQPQLQPPPLPQPQLPQP